MVTAVIHTLILKEIPSSLAAISTKHSLKRPNLKLDDKIKPNSSRTAYRHGHISKVRSVSGTGIKFEPVYVSPIRFRLSFNRMGIAFGIQHTYISPPNITQSLVVSIPKVIGHQHIYIFTYYKQVHINTNYFDMECTK